MCEAMTVGFILRTELLIISLTSGSFRHFLFIFKVNFRLKEEQVTLDFLTCNLHYSDYQATLNSSSSFRKLSVSIKVVKNIEGPRLKNL